MIPALPPDTLPRASIVIAVHNRADDLLECLDSLSMQPLEAFGVEVIVVDDASTDRVMEQIAARHPGVRLLRHAENRGPAASRNAGSREARGGLILYLDSDGVAAPGWLEAMMARHDGDTVLLGCPVDYHGGRVQGTPRRATFLGKSLRCAPHRANTGPSCNLAVPRACFDALGGFDEEIPYYFEDSDLCIRARKAGFRFAYVEQAVFRHKGNEIKKGAAIRMQERNSTYAMLKAYARAPAARFAFSVANAAWLLGRIFLWTLRGRVGEARLLWAGWRQAYRDFRHIRRDSRVSQ
ncbi:MAG: hypothetical protein RLZZ303_1035 [Candidatus Hydrogenedentota bacterium]|jgi:GT2 family glycosyltransferase